MSITYVPSAAVVSINTAGANPTNTATVSWTVTFSTSVTGVNDTAFTPAPSGLSGAFITTVTGSGTTWTVTANTGIGSGTLGLNQSGAGSVSPALTGTFTGQVYTVSATPALAEYRMDEATWNGTAGEIVDNSGNGNNAQAFNSASTAGATPAIAGSPGTCNYGVFDNGATITAAYVQTPLPNLTTDFTITGWIRTTNYSVSGQRIFIDDENNTGGYGFSLGDGAAGRLRFYSRGITPVILDSTYTIANNTWYFVAALADFTNKKRTIYVFNAAGTLLASDTDPTPWTGTWGTDAGPISIGGETNASGESPTTFHFRGNLDEVRVYPKVLSQAAVTAIATQTHACPMTYSVNHFLVDPAAATASTCTPDNVTINVMNAVNNVVTNYTGTVNITTSPAHGDWSTVTAAGTLTPGAADSGTASYTFAAADNGVATLALSDQHADAALSVSVMDPLVATSSTTSTPIAFSDNAFVITNDAVQVAGRPQAISVAMWRKDPSTGVCSISPYYTGAKNLKAWLTLDVSDPGGAAPKIGAVSLPSALPGANNLALTFAAGSANFNLSTSDVGKYALNLRDDSLSFGGAAINGNSNTITTRPFALVVSAIKQGATNNQASSTSGGAVFAKAGTGFQATVGAYLWNSVADTNVAGGDGIPDAAATLAQITASGAALHYAWLTTISADAPYTPAAGTL
ncbi:MAG TPA: LamG domain-containing protein, partial [Burkholderiales bacterium]|nr:LamG domain-containing protein [Burkholderiales bacterium]